MVKVSNHIDLKSKTMLSFLNKWFYVEESMSGLEVLPSSCVGLFVVSIVIISLPQSPLTCCCCCRHSCSVLTLRWRSCWAPYGPPERWHRGRSQRFGAARGAYRFVVPETLPGGGQWSQSRSPLLNTPPHQVHLENQNTQQSRLLIKQITQFKHPYFLDLKSHLFRNLLSSLFSLLSY